MLLTERPIDHYLRNRPGLIKGIDNVCGIWFQLIAAFNSWFCSIPSSTLFQIPNLVKLGLNADLCNQNPNVLNVHTSANAWAILEVKVEMKCCNHTWNCFSVFTGSVLQLAADSAGNTVESQSLQIIQPVICVVNVLRHSTLSAAWYAGLCGIIQSQSGRSPVISSCWVLSVGRNTK